MRYSLKEAVRKGGNGVTRLTCSDKGMSLTCWHRPVCEAVAVNLPPLPPPPAPKKNGGTSAADALPSSTISSRNLRCSRRRKSALTAWRMHEDR